MGHSAVGIQHSAEQTENDSLFGELSRISCKLHGYNLVGRVYRMKSIWKFAVAVLIVAAIYGAAITWQRYKAHANDVKLAENVKTCRARAEQGDAAAQADLAEMYYHGEGVQQDYSEALRWYRKAADHGNAKGQYGVGLIYYHGKGVTMDLGEALRWYRKSADMGFAEAENGIGVMYYLGEGVPQDYA